MKNMKISTRLIVAFLIVILLLVVTGVVSLVMINNVGGSLQQFYDNNYQTVTNVWSARYNLFAMRASVLRSLVDKDPNEVKNCIASAEGYQAAAIESTAKLKETYLGDLSQIDTIVSKLNALTPDLEEVQTYSLSGETDDGYEVYKNEVIPAIESARAILIEVADGANGRAVARVESATALTRTSTIIVIILAVVSAVIGVALALYISNSITKPVTEMQNASHDVATGNLDATITYESRDALGILAGNLRDLTKTFKTIITDVEYQLSSMGNGNFDVSSRAPEAYVGQFARLRTAIAQLNASVSDTLAQIDVSADQVNSGGEQVSSSAQALAQGATEQASSVEELAATINEISNQVEATAGHARNAREDNQQSHDQIEICSAHMSDLMTAMRDIENKSQDISKVIKTIEDTVRAVKEGSRLAAETDDALREVVTRAEKVMTAVNLISEATQEQSRDVAQVTTGIDQISSVVQTNSATAEESAAASEELSGQANLLKELVGRFTLRKDGQGGMGMMSAPRSSAPSYDDSFSGSGYAGNDKY